MKRKKPANHTPRSKVFLEKLGFKTWRVEQWNSWSRTKLDAFNIGDLLAYCGADNGYAGIWLIQVTSGSNHSARVKKVMESEHFPGWCSGGGRFAVLSWDKKSGRYMPKWEELKHEA